MGVGQKEGIYTGHDIRKEGVSFEGKEKIYIYTARDILREGSVD